MADIQLWEVIPKANDVKNDDGVIIGGKTAGTRFALFELIKNYILGGSVQEAVNDWLDEHPEATTTIEDGSVERIKFNESLYLSLASSYDSVSDMLADDTLKDGMFACTKGYYKIGDGGFGVYAVREKTDADVHTEIIGGVSYSVVGDTGNIIAFGDRFDPNNVQLVAELLNKDEVCPEQFGAKGDGTTDDTEAIKYCLKNKKVYARKSYKISQNIQFDLFSGQELDLRGSTFVNTQSGGFFKGNNVTNVKICGGTLVGTGLKDSVNHNIYLINAQNCIIDGVVCQNASGCGIRFDDCDNCRVVNSVCDHCVDFGLESHDGINNVYLNNTLTYNGINLYGTEYDYGRGIVVWREKNALIQGNVVKYNAEYGIRIYSYTDDTSTSENNKIIANTLVDNGGKADPSAKNEIYIYNEGGDKVYDTIVANNTICRSKKGICIANNGIGTIIEGNIFKNLTDLDKDITGVFLYGAKKTIILGNRFEKMSAVIGFSASPLCEEIKFTNNKCSSRIVCQNMYGSEIVIEGNDFKSFNPDSVNNNGIMTDSNTSGEVSNNYLDGYFQAIVTSDNATIIKGNTTKNSVSNGLRKYGDSTDNIIDNHFDKSNPAIFGNLHNDRTMQNRKIAFATSNPSVGTWEVGDIIINCNPSPSYNIGWVCTTAGTPGTWKSFGTISS